MICKVIIAAIRLLPLFLLWLPCALHAGGRKDFDYGDFARIPVLHEGRVKPLDSFARVYLKKIYGDDALPEGTASAWLAETMFAPQEAAREPYFLVRVPEVERILDLPQGEGHYYSFADLAAAFRGRGGVMKELEAKDRKYLTGNEQELVRLYANVNAFAEIMGSFSLMLPLMAQEDMDYLEALKTRRKIDMQLRATVKAKGDRIDAYTPDERYNAEVSYRMSVLETLNGRNTLLRVMPPSWDGKEEWLAPWAVIERGEGSPRGAALFRDWKKLLLAYARNDAVQWYSEAAALREVGAGGPGVRPAALTLETAYNRFQPLVKALILYLVAAVMAAVASANVSRVWLARAMWIAGAAAGLQGMALLARMAILMRPPVSTLYESMIFVSFIAACFSLWLERKRKNGESLLLGSIIACLLLGAANVFAADNDTLEVLVAVLNTNFWLGTHVVCITTGYASSLVAGGLAHMYLVKRASGKGGGESLSALQRRLHGTAVTALFFTAIGTMLGGIWADQSWGRFWGWDPKENGALWIVLWLVWLLHGRMAGQLRELGFACGMAMITIVVALAWVGVNLLSVGLHSYGFTNAAATGLLAFCSVEALCIGCLTVMAYKRAA